MVGIDHAVSAIFVHTGAVATVTVSQVAVITFFDAGLHEAIAAGGSYTGAETGIGIINVAIVTLIHHGGVVVGIDHAVAAIFVHTGTVATVAIGDVAVITFFDTCLYSSIAAGGSYTGAETGIRIIAIGVIALIHHGGVVVGIDRTVAA